tara:strand:- start:157 stop:363 length:207 start_codon:yes stop_codon:yes gene_type:complete
MIGKFVGYVRRRADKSIKVSINWDALKDCETYTTSDGEVYCYLTIDGGRLDKLLQGERVVTTIFQEID